MVLAKPGKVLRGWHPHPSHGNSQLGWKGSAPHLCTPLSPHLKGSSCFELHLVVLRCLEKGKGSAAAAAGAGSKPPCSRLGGLDSSSPVHGTSSPGSSRHQRCRVPADVSLSHSWLRSGAPELPVWGKGQFLLPLVLPIGCSVRGCSVCITSGPASVSPSDHQDPPTSVCSGLMMLEMRNTHGS